MWVKFWKTIEKYTLKGLSPVSYWPPGFATGSWCVICFPCNLRRYSRMCFASEVSSFLVLNICGSPKQANHGDSLGNFSEEQNVHSATSIQALAERKDAYWDLITCQQLQFRKKCLGPNISELSKLLNIPLIIYYPGQYVLRRQLPRCLDWYGIRPRIVQGIGGMASLPVKWSIK